MFIAIQSHNCFDLEQISSYFEKNNALVSIFTLKYKSHIEKRVAMITPDRPSSLNDLAYPTAPHRIEGITIKLFVGTKDEQPIHPVSNKIVSPPSSDDTSDSSTTTDSSDEEPTKPILKSQPALANSSDSDSSTTTSDSDDSDNSVIVSKQSIANQQTNNMNKSFQISSDSSSSQDDSDSTSDSSDSQDDSNDSTSDSSDSSSEDDQPAKKAKTIPIVQTNTKNIPQPKQQQHQHQHQPTPFKRIDPTKVKMNDNVKSNKFVDKPGAFGSYGQKAYEDFSNTRGKGFRQEKNKKKKGSYRGGTIDTGVHSIKFNDSD